MGDTNQVFFPTGDNNNRTRAHNGVSWYYSRNQSMGFAPVGLAVDRASCDTNNLQGERRLCWHTETGNIKAGWRCGTERGLNGGLGWERAIWTRGGQSNCVPPQPCEADVDCDEAGHTCQEGRCLPPPPECLVERDCLRTSPASLVNVSRSCRIVKTIQTVRVKMRSALTAAVSRWPHHRFVYKTVNVTVVVFVVMDSVSDHLVMPMKIVDELKTSTSNASKALA